MRAVAFQVGVWIGVSADCLYERQVQAVRSAEETSRLVESELKDLAATLKNIETARPFEECTTDDVQKAEPEIERKVEHMVKNHRWMPAGYKVCVSPLLHFVS